MIITTLQWLAKVGGRSKSKTAFLLDRGVYSVSLHALLFRGFDFCFGFGSGSGFVSFFSFD